VGDRALTRAVFLDRDGVLNEPVLRNGKPYPPANVSQLRIVPGANGAVERLREAGFTTIVITNQPDVSRGTTSREAVDAIHEALQAAIRVDDIYACFHDDADACDCRKPLPGALLRAARDRNIDLRRSFMVGDRWRDVEAGRAAGVRTVLIDRNYDERLPSNPPDWIVTSLSEAVDRILMMQE
jgi:D-glycero-D-manno-heptose 1,7-bisphosphate phosphatase